jgi:flagellar hook-length control protein FliK
MIFQNKPDASAAVAQAGSAATGMGEGVDPLAKTAQPAAVLATGMLALGADASMRWTIGQTEETRQAQAALPDAVASATVLKPVLFGLNGASKTMPAADATQPGADTDIKEQPKSLAASLILGAGEAMQMAKRQQTKLVAQRVDNIDRVSDSIAAKTALSEVSSDNSSALPAETLIVGEDLSGQDLQAIFTQRTEASAQRASQTAAGNAAASTGADIDLRTEQYEKLSQRLGEALGQRLSAQIARGDWKVELELKPHDLGSIDIQLNMKQGELEATFKASNAMTRELINDGLARLKEVLAQSGMEVAGLNVNIGQNSQHGGNPTPGQQQNSGAVLSAKQGDSAKSTMAMGPATTRKAAGPDGLDVLV